MDIIKKTKDILVTPKTAWQTIAEENQNHLQILTNYLIPLALIPALATFIGYGIIGHTILGVHIGSVGLGLRQAILSFSRRWECISFGMGYLFVVTKI